MKIGDRIREIRKTKNLKGREFALPLGVARGYISTLERHKNEPSEQLVLNICRTFGVLYGWLKNGTGEKYTESLNMFEMGKQYQEFEDLLKGMEEGCRKIRNRIIELRKGSGF